MALYRGSRKICPITDKNVKNQDRYINKNGIYTASEGYSGLGTVTVNVEGADLATEGSLIQIIDYDGKVIRNVRKPAGSTFALPENPSREGMVFEGWSSPIQIVDGTITVPNYDVAIGAIYHTASGLNEFDITLTPVTGLTVNLNLQGTKDWGDGTTDSLNSHTYATTGDYTIKCDDFVLVDSDYNVFGGTNYSCTAARLANTGVNNFTQIPSGAFSHCYSLKYVSMSNTIRFINKGAFSDCCSMETAIIPVNQDLINIGDSAFVYCYGLHTAVLPYSLQGLGISKLCFAACSALRSIVIPETVINIGIGTFEGCYSLSYVKMPPRLSAVQQAVFRNCYSIVEYDFSDFEYSQDSGGIPSLSADAFIGINKICKIKVPAALASQWKAATNWSTYADYIVGV